MWRRLRLRIHFRMLNANTRTQFYIHARELTAKPSNQPKPSQLSPVTIQHHYYSCARNMTATTSGPLGTAAQQWWCHVSHAHVKRLAHVTVTPLSAGGCMSHMLKNLKVNPACPWSGWRPEKRRRVGKSRAGGASGWRTRGWVEGGKRGLI